MLLLFIPVIVFSGFYIYRALYVSYPPSGPLETPFNENPPPYVFFALGDTGIGTPDQYQVAQAMETVCQASPRLDGVFLLGDNFYFKGVDSVEDEQWQTKFESPYGSPCLKKTPFFPVLGNHDYSGNPAAQVDYHRMNPRWHMPNRFYRVSFQNILTVSAFDSVFMDYCWDPEKCSLDFLQESFKKVQSKWHIVLAHHPLFSSSSIGFHYSGEGLLGLFLRPMVCPSNAIWLSGHAHHMEHQHPPHCKGEFFISGGGGGELREVDHPNDARFLLKEHGFLRVAVTESEMKFTFFDQNAQERYSYRRVRES